MKPINHLKSGEWSEQEQAQEQEGENETLKIKKAPLREGPNFTQKA